MTDLECMCEAFVNDHGNDKCVVDAVAIRDETLIISYSWDHGHATWDVSMLEMLVWVWTQQG